MRLGVDASSNQPTLEINGKTCTLPVRNSVLMSLQEGLYPQNSPFFKFSANIYCQMSLKMYHWVMIFCLFALDLNKPFVDASNT